MFAGGGGPMDYREMMELGRDPVRVRTLAATIVATSGDTLQEDWYPFLEGLKKYDGTKPLTTRQLEFLYGLRERATRTVRAGPYRADTLARKAWELRHDLGDDDNFEWLEALQKRPSPLRLSRDEWRRLFAICRKPEIDLLPADEWINI